MNATTTLTADNLPLAVREHLMRGQHDAAVAVLVAEYAQSEADAKQLIEAYRQQLRERKIALEIQMMNEKYALEAKEQRRVAIVWGVRIALVVSTLLLAYLALSAMF